MKKIISLIFILFLIGCSEKDYATCNIEIDNNLENYNMKGTYKIYYDGKYVTSIEKQEKYISPDKYMVDYFEESKSLQYYNLNDLYNGFTYEIEKTETNVNLDISIDMDKVDIKQMVKDKRISKDYVLSNKLTISGAKYIYESMGAKCDI